MDFTLVDGGVAFVTIVSGILAYSRGFTREVFAIGGWVLAALAAFYLAPVVEPLLREAPVVGSFLASSCVISTIAAFTLVVAFALLILSVFTPLFSTVILDSALGPLDRVLGFIFGVARGLVLVAIAYLLYQNLAGDQVLTQVENAASRVLFEEASTLLEANLPDSVPDWFGARIDALMAPCGADVGGAAPAAPSAQDLPTSN